jgi:peptidyl-prolyl cis-trans isomerase D
MTDPLGNLSNSPDLQQILFGLHPGELSPPTQIDNGYIILTVKDILPAHAGTLAEVHDRVLADYQRERSVDLAQARAEELLKRASGGEAFDKAAKSLDLAVKTSDTFSRTGSIPDVGTGRQVDAAFHMAIGQVSKPTQVGENWLVYRVVSRDSPNPDELAKQKDAIEQRLLQTKQNAAFEAFHTALVDRLKKEGKLTINSDAMNRVTRSS